MDSGPEAGRAAEAPDGRAASARNGHGEHGLAVDVFQELAGGLATLIELQADRLRLALKRSLVRAGIALACGVFVVTWTVTAALALLRGLSAGLTSLFGGRAWLGELSAGLLALVLLAVSVAITLHLEERRELARLKAKYERKKSEPRERSPDETAGQGERGGVPPAP